MSLRRWMVRLMFLTLLGLAGVNAVSGQQLPRLPSMTYMTDVITPIHFGEIIGDIAKGYANAANPVDTQLLDGGNLDFLVDGVVVCSLPYITGVSQTCPATTGAGYPAGTYVLSAAYTGNQYYEGSASPGYPVVVLSDDTTATVSSSVNPSTVGQAVTFTAVISSVYATPVGTVTFFDGATQIGTATLGAGGVGTMTTSALAVGTHAITVRYAGNSNFNASASAALQQVVNSAPVATVTTLASSANPSVVGQTVTFTAVVTTGSIVTVSPPVGTVTFTVDGVVVGSGTLNASGSASVSVSTLALGSHTVVASYGGGTAATGDAFSASSATLVQQVNAPPPASSFTMTVTPAALSVPIGNYVSVVVKITPLGGFNQPVTLSCGSLPRSLTCSFGSTTIPTGNGTTLLTVHAVAPHDCGSNSPYFVASGPATWLGGLAMGGLVLLVRRRRGLVKGIVLALAVGVLPMLGGCGQCTDLGLYPGNYSFVVTGQSTSGGTLPVTNVQQTSTQTIKVVAHL